MLEPPPCAVVDVVNVGFCLCTCSELGFAFGDNDTDTDKNKRVLSYRYVSHVRKASNPLRQVNT